MMPEFLGTAMLFIQPEHCVPLQIIPETGSGAGRLGGTPPIEIAPPSGSTGLAYFATLPLVGNPAAHVSIFVSRLEQLMCMRGRVNPSGGIEVCVHYALPRNPSPTPWDSHLSASRLGVLPEADDWIVDDDGSRRIRPGHKLGGRPHLIRTNARLIEDLQQLARRKYIHVAQFDFPGADDATVSGNWPFADGIFSLFASQPYGADDWAWCWDF